MLTFHPFVRAVKLPAPELLVWALFLGLGASCVTQRAARAGDAPSTGPVTAAGSAVPSPVRPFPVGQSLTQARPSTPPALPELEPRATEEPAREDLALELELPYSGDAVLQAADPRLAASEDAEVARWNLGGSAEPTAAGLPPSFHPGTRVTVDVRLAKRRVGSPPSPPLRGLTLERVLAQTRSRGYWPFRRCFESGQRERPGNGGETRIAFTIGTRGRVRAARLLASELKNPASEACLARELLKLEYTPPPARVLAMVATVALWPGDLPLSAVPTTAEALVDAPNRDFDAIEVRTRIAALMPELRECFAAGRRRDPSLWGRLALAFTLEVDGSVHRITEAETRFPSQSVTRCAEALLASVVFPSVNGKPFTFVAPLRLAPSFTPEAASSAGAPSSTNDRKAPSAD